MALFKCKMCGGTLEINDNETVGTCEYCGTQQTLPRLEDDRRANLYDRANHFRRNNEFDKAMGMYERILSEDTTDAEAYWSLVLCRYGIEYVEDPATHKRIPTVNRAQYTSIFDDDNYKSALQYADGHQRHIYEEEAKAINEIQKGILAISQKEEPFDVFICYKETDRNGRRTPDSVLANDLYHQLTQEGFKVFFSRITLEDKLGVAYEPYIFAALNSAKVMVVVGTKPEYFNAVWVKNEWSRYLALIKNGAKKILIPAYRDMDPYDLPEEFSHLQAQDMSKLGFMQDLIRGIKKIAKTDEPKAAVVKETIITGTAANTAPLLKRAFMFLEDEDWDSADEYCEKVLDIDPENAQAYLGKLMAELNVSKQEELRDQEEAFDKRNNYRKVIRFADTALKKALEGYIDYIYARNENERLEGIYDYAKRTMENADTEEAYKKAAHSFESIPEYKDSATLAKECYEKAETARLESIYSYARQTMKNASTESAYKKAADSFETIPDYKDSAALAQECYLKAEDARKDGILGLGKAEMGKNTILDYYNAIKYFASIPGWKDADERRQECQERIDALAAQAEADRLERERQAEADRLEKERQAEIARQEALKRAKRNRKIAILAATVVTLAIVVTLLLNMVILPSSNYKKAEELLAAGDNAGAAMAFGAAGNWEDARERSFELWDQIAQREILGAGQRTTYGLKADGTVVAAGYSYSVENMTDIIAISAAEYHTVGLKADGTVVTAGRENEGQRNAENWSDIVAISAGYYHIAGLRSDGTVVAVGSNDSGQCKVNSWKDIVAVSAGSSHTVGLCSDGTVVAAGSNGWGQCEVSDWTDIVAICAGANRTVGLKADGTVVAVGSEQDAIVGWTDIVAISSGFYHIVGLRSNGTVVAVGDSYHGYSDGQCEVSSWKDIVAITTGTKHTVGLRSDGTVVAVGSNGDDQCEVSSWENIMLPSNREDMVAAIQEKQALEAQALEAQNSEQYSQAEALLAEGKTAEAAMAFYAIGNYQDARERSFALWAEIRKPETVSAGSYHTVGLCNDGTVVAVGNQQNGEGDVSTWADIVAVSAGSYYTVGLCNDGTVVATGSNQYGECNVSDWSDIVAISADEIHTVGLRIDGTVVATGYNEEGACNVGDWTDIVAISAGSSYTVGLKADGTVMAVGWNEYGQCDVSDWTDVVAVSAGLWHTVGLRSDGTVVAAGDNDYGQCDVTDWTDIVAISEGWEHTVGLRSDGTVVAAGENHDGQCDVEDWTDIIAISAGSYYTVGLRSDGTVVTVGTYFDGPVDVSGWTNIKLPD